MQIERSWANIVTVSCLIIVAGIEALQQALSGAPSAAAMFPGFVMGPTWHFVPLALLVIAGLVWLAGNYAKRGKVHQASSNQQQGVVTSSTGQFQNVDEFYRTYDNVLLRECEDNIRAQSDKYQPGRDREKFLIRFFATTLLTGIFEYIWLLIFRSQLLMLETLNKGQRNIDTLRVFYDAAITAENTEFYANYSFASWLAFLKTYVPIREEGAVIQLTIRGHEFLKYLVATGRSSDDRRN